MGRYDGATDHDTPRGLREQTMGKQSGDTRKLRKLLIQCLNQGFSLSLFLPNSDIRNPTWDELREYATEAYALALRDVLSAMDGNSEPLMEAMETGRLLVSAGDKEIFLERLEALVKNPPDDLDDDEEDEVNE